jgi:hypothetical protein
VPNDRLAQVAYAAYCEAIHHPLDEWKELGPEDKAAWRAVADAVVIALGEGVDLIQDDTAKP